MVDSIYRMVGHMVTFPPDEATPQQRVDKMFQCMDLVRLHNLQPSFTPSPLLSPPSFPSLPLLSSPFGFLPSLPSHPPPSHSLVFSSQKDGDGMINLEDFVLGAKKDPTIIQALSLYESLL